MENWVNCWKPKSFDKAISSQALATVKEGSETIRDGVGNKCYRSAQLPTRDDDIVQSLWKHKAAR